jgi:hypothetical protein
MVKKQIALPLERGYDQAYELSYEMACNRLKTNSDIMAQCVKAGAQYVTKSGKNKIQISYLGHTYFATLPGIEIASADTDEPVPVRDRLLILHYFNTASGATSTNRLINFRELPSGQIYYPTFYKRTISPIIDKFHKKPEKLIAAAGNLGGLKSNYGDVSVEIPAFPKVNVGIVYWKGDAELTPEVNILFDANISTYLPIEDITVLSETIAWKLVKSPV